MYLPLFLTALFGFLASASANDEFSTEKCPRFIIHNVETIQVSGKLKAVRMEKFGNGSDSIVLYFEQVYKESNFSDHSGMRECEALPAVYFEDASQKAMFYSAATQALSGNLTLRVKTNVSDGSIGGRAYSLLANSVELIRE